MSNVFDAVAPDFRKVIVEEIKRRNPRLFEDLNQSLAPTNAQSDAVVDLLIDALSANYGQGHIPNDYGKIVDNAIGAYLMAWPINR